MLPLTAASRPTSEAPLRRERVEVEVRPVGRADELGRRDVPRAHQVVDLVVALVEPADPVQPPHDVAAAVGPGHADVLADGDGHLAPGAQQLVGDLEAGGRGADDEHAAAAQLVGPLVVERGELVELGRAATPTTAGTCGWLKAPLATTTAAASQVPASVSTR